MVMIHEKVENTESNIVCINRYESQLPKIGWHWYMQFDNTYTHVHKYIYNEKIGQTRPHTVCKSIVV